MREIKHFIHESILRETLKDFFKTINESETEELLRNEFNERWVKLSKGDTVFTELEDIIKSIDNRNNGPKVVDVAKVDDENDNRYVSTIYGGENGSGKWSEYFDVLKQICTAIVDCWIIDLINDPADDVWTLRLAFRK
jgi:hypothetical protein